MQNLSEVATNFHSLKNAAEQGDSYSQWKLGTLYQLNSQDSGSARDLQLALKWFTLAAQQGLSQAQESLGGMYERGEGVPQDTETALKWYALALDSVDKQKVHAAVDSDNQDGFR